MSEPSELPNAEAASSQRRVKDILLSTLLVGGGSIVNVLTGIVRGKVISTVLGPVGIGLQGLLQSTLRTASSLAGMGVQTSGVREVARLRGEENPSELSHTLRALRLATVGLGLFAALFLAVCHRPLGAAILGNADHGWMLAILGIGVLAQTLFGMYDAYLRGFRRVGLITKTAVAANILSTGVAVGAVVLLGEDGIVWALVAQPLCMLALAAVAGRDFASHLVPPDRAHTREAMSRLIRMGVVLAATGFISTGVQLAARVMIAHFTTLDDVGYFQAAWAVSVLYLGFVMSAMGLDYYPRLAEVGSKPDELTRMVNEQGRISFLLGGPAVLGMLALSNEVIALLYTSSFTPAVPILRWQLLGDVLKIGSWTLGYLLLAQGRPRVFFFTELSWNVLYLVALAALVPSVGVEATGVAYLIASAIYFVVLCAVAKRVAGFAWSRGNLVLIVLITALAVVELAAHLLLRRWSGLAVGVAITAVFASYCLWRLLREAGLGRFTRRRKS